MPEGSQVLVIMPEQIQRADAKGFSYRASRTMTKRAVRDVHLAHVRIEPDDEIILLTNRGRGWRGTVGFIPTEATPQALGLPPEEHIVDIAVLRPDTYLVMGTRGGKVKRTEVADLSLPNRTWDTVMGVGDEGEDGLLFGRIAGAGAHVLFYTAQGQLLRIDGDTINPQQTGTATGVVGISLNKGDHLIGGTVVPNAAADEGKYYVVVISERGYVHRAPLAEFSVQGRGARGVRYLRPTKSGGNVGGIVVAHRGIIDAYLDSGRRQRLDLNEIPEGARGVRGERLIDTGTAAVTRIVNLS
jgi:DNA gyrase/topoisomerase IV subunit A